jgi:hypothetical protein
MVDIPDKMLVQKFTRDGRPQPFDHLDNQAVQASPSTIGHDRFWLWIILLLIVAGMILAYIIFLNLQTPY